MPKLQESQEIDTHSRFSIYYLGMESIRKYLSYILYLLTMIKQRNVEDGPKLL
jgi:hypothetical protein